MNIEQMLQQTGAIDAISRELHIDPTTARAGATALLPSILSGFQNPVAPAGATAAAGPSDRGAFPDLGGLGALLGSIGGLGGGALLDNAVANEPTEVDKGNQVLGQIFGSKDGSRAVAAQAASQSGVEPSLLKKMLPILAMVAAGYIMKNAGQGQGGLGGMIGGMLGEQSPAGSPQPAPRTEPDILGSLIGAAGKFLAR
jgi:hypothetical protein